MIAAPPPSAGPASPTPPTLPAPPVRSAPPATRTPKRLDIPRILGAVAQLAALALIWPFVFSVLITLLSSGLGLVPVLGIGLVVLVAFVYVLFGAAWLEQARVDGLYGFGLAPLRLRPRVGPGFGGWLRTLWAQFIDGAVWRAIAHAALSTLLGFLVLALVSVLGSGVALLFAPLFGGDSARIAGIALTVPTSGAIVIGIIGIVVAIAGLVGLGILHATLARAILVPSQEARFAEQARTSDAQRAGAVRASEVERTRIERDLHDGVQPRLVSVGMTLGLAQQKIDSDPDAARELIAEAHTSTKAAITELRQLARGIHASVLDDRGLDAALSALAARSHVPVHLDVRVDGRCSKTAEAAVYFVIAESLTNAAKHSRASECRVVVRSRPTGEPGAGGTLWARVEDNGVGGARVLPGGGLDGITNRILAAGGTARLDSPVGGPTSLEVSVPCAS